MKKNKRRGNLVLIISDVFVKKTNYLISLIKSKEQEGKRTLIFKPVSNIFNKDVYLKNTIGERLEVTAIPVSNPNIILGIIRKKEKSLTGKRTPYQIIIFDEVQFFLNRSNFFLIVDELLNCGYDVIAAGVGLDYNGEPYKIMALLSGFCQEKFMIGSFPPTVFKEKYINNFSVH